ncbi:excalibur calcium-binding domain-containing protein [Coralloluteibacterium stylophorae]|uniref:Excalibur calcium-binding domain-containing protein n=1 Tax=Coralloluteibacterium stylophorae TaxID=1776034 RepID=A0A8J7VRV1_9GAMM|nr:excalibur calcium-binding domain-containing protein [Coralloluteibacterium stylophorae]MBS7456015.1 excalibur calcium-binding domain-containing protein [Coralloluteibacterium stylophorae]
MKSLVVLLILGLAAWGAYRQFNPPAPPAATPVVASGTAARQAPARALPAPAPAYTCDGRRHCSQMRSCAEATYFIQHCPNTEMDGDGDGVPCERQWCG